MTEICLSAPNCSELDEKRGSNDFKTAFSRVSAYFSVLPASSYLGLLLVVTSTGFFSYHWYLVEQFLLDVGSYAWKCDIPVCPKQQEAVSVVLVVYIGLMFIFACLGGLFLDFFGVKVAFLIGLMTQCIGWTVLAYSMGPSNLPGSNFDFTICFLAGYITLGISEQLLLVSALKHLLATAPSKHIPLLFSTTLGLRSLQPLRLFPPAFFLSLSPACAVFNGIMAVCVLMVWTPKRSTSPLPIDRESSSVSENCQTTQPLASPYCDTLSTLLTVASTSAGSQQGLACQGYKLPKGFKESRILQMSSLTGAPTQSAQCLSHYMSTDRGYSDPSQPVSGFEAMSPVTKTALFCFSESRDSNTPILILLQKYVFMLLYLLVIVLNSTYLNTSIVQQLPNLQTLPFLSAGAIVPLLIFGVIGTKSNVFVVFCCSNTFALVIFILLIVAGTTQSFLVASLLLFLIWGFTSFALTSTYTFIASNFSHRFFGFLTGFLFFTVGTFSLIATPVTDFSSVSENRKSMDILCLILTLLNYGCIYKQHQLGKVASPTSVPAPSII